MLAWVQDGLARREDRTKLCEAVEKSCKKVGKKRAGPFINRPRSGQLANFKF